MSYRLSERTEAESETKRVSRSKLGWGSRAEFSASACDVLLNFCLGSTSENPVRACGGDVQYHSPTSLTPALDQLPDIDHHNCHGPCCDHRKRIPLFFGSGPTKAAKRCIKDRRVAPRLPSGRLAKSKKKCSRKRRCELFSAATFLFFPFFPCRSVSALGRFQDSAYPHIFTPLRPALCGQILSGYRALAHALISMPFHLCRDRSKTGLRRWLNEVGARGGRKIQFKIVSPQMLGTGKNPLTLCCELGEGGGLLSTHIGVCSRWTLHPTTTCAADRSGRSAQLEQSDETFLIWWAGFARNKALLQRQQGCQKFDTCIRPSCWGKSNAQMGRWRSSSDQKATRPQQSGEILF